MIAEATDGVNVGLNLPHPLLLQGFGGVAPKNCLQQTTYTIFCNNLHFASAKNRLDYVITRQELEEADSLSRKLDRDSTQEPIHSDPTGDSGQQSHLIPR